MNEFRRYIQPFRHNTTLDRDSIYRATLSYMHRAGSNCMGFKQLNGVTRPTFVRSSVTAFHLILAKVVSAVLYVHDFIAVTIRYDRRV